MSAVQSNAEKKARKAILTSGLVPVAGVNRVTFTVRGTTDIYAFENPEVFMSTNSDTHIVFGEMKSEQPQSQFGEQLATDAENAEKETAAADETTETAAANEEEDDEEVDATGVKEEDIELVISQANVSRTKAIKALKKNENDVVNSIMDLTM